MKWLQKAIETVMGPETKYYVPIPNKLEPPGADSSFFAFKMMAYQCFGTCYWVILRGEPEENNPVAQ